MSFNQYIQEWEKKLSREKGKRTGNNKLRTYRLLKNTFDTENYVKCFFNKKYRSSLAKFRCGTAPIRLELGRYEGLPVEDRKCPFCIHDVEDEVHVLTKCSLYPDIRNELYNFLSSIFPHFMSLSDQEKTRVILSSQDFNTVKFVAKTCSMIMDRRRRFI